MSEKAYHSPVGDPCEKCGCNASRHRPSHKPEGDPCKKCGLKAEAHRVQKKKPDELIVGIDGEGQGRSPHRYTLLAASDETGTHSWYVERLEGLSTKECLDFILYILPNHVQPFGFSFRYDITMILRDLPNGHIYRLLRPELRTKYIDGRSVHTPVFWFPYGEEEGQPGYALNFLSGKLTLRGGRVVKKKLKLSHRKKIVWDVFKFYQSSFVKALRDWKTASEEECARIQAMKERRDEFNDLMRRQVRQYCLSECQHLARLVRQLVEAHETAGLELTQFYGAGSTASAMFDKHGLKEQISRQRENTPKEVEIPFACAFFGGRFENSHLGTVEGPLYAEDISSAYPYEATFLPCLAHGKWRLSKKHSDLERVTAACVRYSLGKPPSDLAWAPFPFRTKEGSVVFPARSAGGWSWLSEFVSAERLYGSEYVRFEEAWVYERDCSCPCPFRFLPEYYAERVRIGKEGAGIILKLGPNSTYGKLAQAVGGRLGTFTDWAYAGMITAGTRAKILDLVKCLSHPSQMLAVATDGVLLREKLAERPVPRETGTGILFGPDGKEVRKPLGGWEHKASGDRVFMARPGIFFPFDEEGADTRARGLGRKVLNDARKLVVEAFEKGASGCVLPGLTRFIGAKTSIYRVRAPKGADHKWDYLRSESYGDWIERGQALSFDPLPKREMPRQKGEALRLRSFPESAGMSTPYDKAKVIDPEVLALRAARELLEEQPEPLLWEDEG